jgi:hypothetical protein
MLSWSNFHFDNLVDTLIAYQKIKAIFRIPESTVRATILNEAQAKIANQNS